MVQAWGRPGPAGERDHEPSACLVGLTVWREMQIEKQAIADHPDRGDRPEDSIGGKLFLIKIQSYFATLST